MYRLFILLLLVTQTWVLAANYEGGTPRRASRRLASDPLNEYTELPWWKPEAAVYSVGFETSSAGLFGQNALIFGWWLNDQLGVDLYFGYAKSANTQNENISVATNSLTKAQTTTTTYSGAKFPFLFTLGGSLKYRLFQSSWFQVNVGPAVAVTTPGSADYRGAGTLTKTVANTDDPTTFSISDQSSSVNFKQDLGIIVGPRVQTEFYLKWIPHLGIGMTAALMTRLGQTATTTTTTLNKVYQTTSGVAQAPTTDSSTVQTSSNSPNPQGTTVGIAGTTFSLFGTFCVRYIW